MVAHNKCRVARRLNMDQWLALTRQGLSPCKMWQASLVALTFTAHALVFASYAYLKLDYRKYIELSIKKLY